MCASHDSRLQAEVFQTFLDDASFSNACYTSPSHFLGSQRITQLMEMDSHVHGAHAWHRTSSQQCALHQHMASRNKHLFIPTHRRLAGLLHFRRNNPWQCCTVSMLLPRHSSPSKIFRVREYLLCCHASLLSLGLEQPRSADLA